MRNKKLLYILSVFAILFYSSILFAAVPVEVTVGKETVLKLNKPIKSIQRVSLANEDIADIKPLIATSPNEVEIIINGKKPGVTSLIIWDTEGKTFFDVIVLEKLDREITYENKIRALKSEIKAIAPNDDISVKLSNDTIVLSGYAANEQTINKAVQIAQTYAIASDITTSTKYSAGVTTTESTTTAKVLNHIKIKEAQQVMLEVRVAQIDKSKLKELGLSVLIKGSDAEGFTNLAGAPTGILGDKIIFDKTDSTISKTRGSSITGFDLNSLAPQIGVSHFPGGVSVVLKALATKGLAKIIAEPNLVVRSGEKGNFLAGKQVPVQVVTGTPPTPSIEYRDVGIKLNFAPEVLETGVIRLKIDPAEVSSISKYLTVGGLIAPEIDTRKVTTSVDLKEGESLILAGLLSEEMIKNMQKIPILGDIPILGALFRSTHDELSQKELAFFITPKLVKPIPPGVKTELPGENRPTPEEERELQWIPLPPPSSDTSSQAPAKDKDPRDYPVW